MSTSENGLVPPRPASSRGHPERVIQTVGGGVPDLDQELAILEVEAAHLKDTSRKLSEQREMLQRRVATTDPASRRYLTLTGSSVDLDDVLARTKSRTHEVDVGLAEPEAKLQDVRNLITAFDAQKTPRGDTT